MSADLFRNSTRDASATTPSPATTLTLSSQPQPPHTPTMLAPADSRIPIASPAGVGGNGAFRRCASMRLPRLTTPPNHHPHPHHQPRIQHSHSHHGAVGHKGSENGLAGIAVASSSRKYRDTTAKTNGGLTVPSQDYQQSGSRVRSLSLSLSTPRLSAPLRGGGGDPRTPPTTPNTHHLTPNTTNTTTNLTANKYHNASTTSLGIAYHEDDLDSLNSYASLASTASCDHPFVAHNGTTFSGRRMKYVVHCSAHAGQTGDEYLTPTQRAQKQIKRLKLLLQHAKHDIETKDSDIFRLTKEVVELRVFKATLNSPEDKSNSSDAVTVRENATDDMKTPESPTCTDFTDDDGKKSGIDMTSSFADSGHFDDLNISKDSVVQTCDKACLARLESSDDERRIVEMYEKKLEDLIRAHVDQTQELKQKHNEKIEELLQRLSDVNLRYCQLMPNYDQARERIQELEKQLDELNRQLEEQEAKNKQLYLQMYNKGIEAAKLEQQEQAIALAQPTPSRVSVSDLLLQLQVTQTELENIKDTTFTAEHTPQAQSLLSAKEAVSLWVLGARKAMYRRLVELKNAQNEMDPEITLQFLKSAIYYFLTDKENHQGHLKAIQSILGFTPTEISNIDKARAS